MNEISICVVYSVFQNYYSDLSQIFFYFPD